jgi:DNA (cytosine-5)-methyltransferase 1
LIVNELSLFSGAGGGLLATKHLLGWNTIGYVEINQYCQRVIAQRITDGLLDLAPTFGDIRLFLSQGFAASYTGLVDIITGGDPCQANSNASQGGSQAESFGGEFIEVINQVRPAWVLRENPSQTRKDAPWPSDRFIDGLESIGYTAIPIKIRACCLGADHERERMWVLGARSDSDPKPVMEAVETKMPSGDAGWKARGDACRPFRGSEQRIPWVLAESDICREIDSVAHRMDRLEAIGNGQDPFMAATAWRILSGAD